MGHDMKEKFDSYSWDFCKDLLDAPHVLIAGATGSGKSVLLNDLIFTALSLPASKAAFILIDPKKTELVKYKNLPHCAAYINENKEVSPHLAGVCKIMDRRYKAIARGATFDKHIYIVIDELADLMITHKKEVLPLLQRIAQLGRAANIHLWACTQSPSRLTIPAALTLNFTHKIALRCDSAIESRQVIGRPGAETLPQYGKAIIKAPGKIWIQDIPLTPKEDITAKIKFWGSCYPWYKRLFRPKLK